MPLFQVEQIVGRRLFVGISSRTNSAALDQLRRFVEPHGYEVIDVEVRGVLHLKSAVTQVGATVHFERTNAAFTVDSNGVKRPKPQCFGQ